MQDRNFAHYSGNKVEFLSLWLYCIIVQGTMELGWGREEGIDSSHRDDIYYGNIGGAFNG